MNKTDLIEKMAEAADISKSAAERALDAFTDAVTNSLSQGDPVALIGFGRFDTSKRAERKGRNPQTGETIVIPASIAVRFKAGKKLKDAVNDAG